MYQGTLRKKIYAAKPQSQLCYLFNSIDYLLKHKKKKKKKKKKKGQKIEVVSESNCLRFY